MNEGKRATRAHQWEQGSDKGQLMDGNQHDYSQGTKEAQCWHHSEGHCTRRHPMANTNKKTQSAVLGVGVVLRQLGYLLREGHNARRCDYPRLPHATTQNLAQTTRL